MSLNNTPSGERALYWSVWKTERREIQHYQCNHRTESGNRLRYRRHHHRPCHKVHGITATWSGCCYDTPGLDDVGELGALRIRKAYQMLNKTDIALLIIDSGYGVTDEDLRIF